MRLDHLLSKELTIIMVAHVCARVLYGWVAHGWNINELNTGKRVHAGPHYEWLGCVSGYWLWLYGVGACEYALLLHMNESFLLGGFVGVWWWCWNVGVDGVWFVWFGMLLGFEATSLRPWWMI